MSVEYTSRQQELLTNMKNRTTIAVRFLLDDIHSAANPITPLKDMGLRTSVYKTMGIPENGIVRGTIEWRVPYAQYQERGRRYNDPPYTVRHYTTPGTGKHFASRAVQKSLQQIPMYFGGRL